MRPRPSRRQRAVSAAIFGGILGALGGAVIGDSFAWPGAGLGAALGAVIQATGEGVTDWLRRPGAPSDAKLADPAPIGGDES